MKKIIFNLFFVLILLFFLSCQRKDNIDASEDMSLPEEQVSSTIGLDDNKIKDSLLPVGFEDFDWLMDHTWIFNSGYYEPFNRLIFRKLELPSGIDLYQQRLRRDYFRLMYQTE